jgi:rare lipoprotein A
MLQIAALLILSQQPLEPVMQGVASYYTVASSSAVTASGERFSDAEYTCAMLTGEFGDHFMVVADNGNSVVVKLNDRGPYVDDRIIDLSEAAIRALHPTAGLVNVTIYPLGKEGRAGPMIRQ